MNDWTEWVGRSTSDAAFLDPAQANRMQVTLDREPTFAPGDALPPAWHWLFFHEVVRACDLGTDGHPALGITMPPVPLPRRMWAAGTMAFESPLVLGAEATRTSRIAAVSVKKGRTGPLYFVTVEHDIRQDERTAVRESRTIVYRELGVPAGAEAPAAPAIADFSDRWDLDSTTLFRYSALTFNSHRIHYDADYCRSVEGYPNLVIHGPLLATLLLDSVVRRGLPVYSVEYRARSPLFVPDGFTVNGKNDGDTAHLWTASLDGRLAMEAEVRHVAA